MLHFNKIQCFLIFVFGLCEMDDNHNETSIIFYLKIVILYVSVNQQVICKNVVLIVFFVEFCIVDSALLFFFYWFTECWYTIAHCILSVVHKNIFLYNDEYTCFTFRMKEKNTTTSIQLSKKRIQNNVK